MALDLCNPSPCGSNALCNDGECSCLPEYHGDPYVGCRPECTVSTDCQRNQICARKKCVNPCPDTCGPNAICEVINHIPMCSCPAGYTGNSFVSCNVLQGMLIVIPFISITYKYFLKKYSPVYYLLILFQHHCQQTPVTQVHVVPTVNVGK